jgi:hypothetical protein
MTAMIENVQGQIDQIVPTVAALAGVPEANFQISPNSVDLKQFGDKVMAQEELLKENRLGSTVPSLDKSVAGEGILLRASNGTLVEASIEWTGTAYQWVFSEV